MITAVRLLLQGLTALALVVAAVSIWSISQSLLREQQSDGLPGEPGMIRCVESRTGYHWESSFARRWRLSGQGSGIAFLSSDGKQFFPVPGSECELVSTRMAR